MSGRRELAHYVRIATWLEQPRLPGLEREFQAWVGEQEDNHLEWQQWQHLMLKTRRLQVDPLDVDVLWVSLRDSLGLHRKKRVSRSAHRGDRSAISRIGSFFRRPIVVAVGAMIALGSFFLLLYLIRSRMGF